MTPNPVPSREGVETFVPSNGAMICCAQGTGEYVQKKDYLAALAAVERLTDHSEKLERLILTRRSQEVLDELVSLRATVAAQAAALNELMNNWRSSGYTSHKMCADELCAALASQTKDYQPKESI